MRVLAWVPQERDTSPGQRFRIEQWEPHLRREGIEVVYLPFATAGLAAVLHARGRLVAKTTGVLSAFVRRLRHAVLASRSDLVYVFREGAVIGPAVAERIISWKGVPFVFDFDDPVWVRYVSPANSYLSYLRFPGKTATLCRLARHVIAGNAYLERYADAHNPRVTVVPTTIDTERYRPAARRSPARPTIGWTGSYSTMQYLQLVRLVLERLRRRRDFRVVVVGGQGFEADGVEVEHRPWRSASEVEDISDFDIGIMPLPNNEWERGKCGLKALQYLALGIPAVVSPVGVNSEIVVDGRNGFLAQSESAWEEALDRLLADPSLRWTLGAEGRATVERSYSARVHAPRVAAVLRSAVR